MKARKRIEFGEYIVSDPEICGRELTFKGTCILVEEVLYYVAKDKDWDEGLHLQACGLRLHPSLLMATLMTRQVALRGFF